MAGFLERLVSSDKRTLAKLEKKAEQVMALEEKMRALSQEEMITQTNDFKERVKNGESLDDLLPEAYAAAREAARRVLGEHPYKVQIMGAVAMHQGDIAEMKTGEGKTLTATMCVYLNALAQRGVHVVTVNEYLAERDAEWMGEIYRYLGLTVGVNKRELLPVNKREAYNCDITYTTNSELGFDYLRDNMVTNVKDRTQRPLWMAVIDEVDSILIDESRTPLIISGGKKKTANLYIQADQFVKRLRKPVYEEDTRSGEKKLVSGGYEIDEKTRQVMLSEEGVKAAERFFRVENLYDVAHTQLVHHIRVVGYINISLMATVKNTSVVAADLAAGRHLNDQQRAAVYGAGFRLQVQRRIDFLPVVDGSHEVFFHTVNRIRGNTQNLPVVFDAQENDSTVPVGKRTDGIVNILCNLGGGFLKLHPDVLAVLDQLQKFSFCHRSNSPPFDVDLYVLIIRDFSRIIKPILRGYIILKWFSVILENARQCLAN